MNKTKVKVVLGLSISVLTFAGTTLALAETPAPAAPAAAPAPAAAATGGASVAFETPIFDFGKIKSGEPVKHTFVFTNTGTETLVISNVQPACGCTTSGEWTRQVEPGKTGTIPIQFNSANFNGAVAKHVTVTSNDKTQPNVTLQIKGTIWKPVDVNPQFAVMNVPPDSYEPVKSEVRIINNTEQAFTLSAPESNNKFFKADLETITAGKEFKVTITTVPPLESGNVQGQITLKSTSTEAPVINITAWATVQAAVAVNPAQIVLPGGPLGPNQTASVTIQNNVTNVLKVSEATVDAKGVDVKLTEPQPGKLFTATLTFPEGFEVPQGTPINLSLKTSHPNHSVIKVPVLQLPKLPVAQPNIVPLTPPPPQAATKAVTPAVQ
jgi:hypothetical protein